MTKSRASTYPPKFQCPHCGERNNVSPAAAETFFRNVRLNCGNCQRPLNWWDVVVKTIKDNFMYTQAFGIVGANTTFFVFNMQPNGSTVVNFAEYGVPDEARILAVNYTPQSDGGLFPLQWHSNQLIDNQSMWPRGGTSHEVHLWPAAFKDDKALTEIACMVTWVAASPDDPVMSNLVEAFAAYARDRYTDVIIPANIAVEASVTRVLDTYLARFVSRERVDGFLTDAATYAWQLTVLMPVLAHLNKCPKMPKNVQGRLNRLRSLRNMLAHQGCTEVPLKKNEIAELLASATLGVAYTKFFERSVDTHSV